MGPKFRSWSKYRKFINCCFKFKLKEEEEKPFDESDTVIGRAIVFA